MPTPTSPPSKGGATRRAAPTKVAKPFPWGTALGSVVLATALIGTITYAAVNQGSGVSGLIRDPDKAIDGVTVAAGNLSQQHVPGPVRYPQTPPNSGNHNIVAQQCAVYTAPIAPEHAVHSLEHGAVWITYNASVPADQVQELAREVSNNPYRLMSPLPEQTSPINVSAWGRRLSVDNASDGRIDQFLTAYTNGPQTKEPGAACAGTSDTGPLMETAPAPAPAPVASTPAS